jgi:hypothetical protein
MTFRVLKDSSMSEAARVAGAVLMGCRDQGADALRDLAQNASRWEVRPTQLRIPTAPFPVQVE